MSAGREYRRRMERREARIRAVHPKLAPLLLALSSVPERESAFERGARGERTVAAGLQAACRGGLGEAAARSADAARAGQHRPSRGRADRRVRDRREAHKGKVRIARPVFGPAKLLINGRDRTKLLDGLDRQVEAVRQVLSGIDCTAISIHGVLCFTNADLSWLRTARVRGHLLTYGRALAGELVADGPLTASTVGSLAGALGAALPPA